MKKSVADFFCLESGTAGASRTVVAGALAVGVIATTMGVALAGDHIDGHCDDPSVHYHHMEQGQHNQFFEHCDYQAAYHCNC